MCYCALPHTATPVFKQWPHVTSVARICHLSYTLSWKSVLGEAITGYKERWKVKILHSPWSSKDENQQKWPMWLLRECKQRWWWWFSSMSLKGRIIYWNFEEIAEHWKQRKTCPNMETEPINRANRCRRGSFNKKGKQRSMRQKWVTWNRHTNNPSAPVCEHGLLR